MKEAGSRKQGAGGAVGAVGAGLLALLTVAFVLVWAGDASAQFRHGRIIGPRAYFYTPFAYYDPFWGPYPYAYGGYPLALSRPRADVKVEVTPKQAEVYVDGFYAGVADDFDGAFKRLHVTPGGHAISLHLAGYRTTTENIYAAPGSTVKVKLEMQPLAAGETSDYPPLPAYTQTR